MPATTPILALPYPTPDDSVDVPRDIQALATKIDPLGVVPVGCMMMWPTAVAPGGWLICNGSQVSAATYPGLAALLGSSGGNVTLPSLGGRMPVGADGTHALGATGGEETHTLTPAEAAIRNHTHGGTTASENSSLSHSHSFQLLSDRTPTASPNASVDNLKSQNHDFQAVPTFNTANGGPSPHTHNFTTGNPTNANGAAHNNMPPYLTVNYIIRAG